MVVGDDPAVRVSCFRVNESEIFSVFRTITRRSNATFVLMAKDEPAAAAPTADKLSTFVNVLKRESEGESCACT